MDGCSRRVMSCFGRSEVRNRAHWNVRARVQQCCSQRIRFGTGWLGVYLVEVSTRLATSRFGLYCVDVLTLVWKRVTTSRRMNRQEWLAFLKHNFFAVVLTTAVGIGMFESSTNDLRRSLASAVVFPMYLPHPVGLAVAAKYDSSVDFGNFVGFYLTRIYSASRGGVLTSATRGAVFFVAAVLGTGEVFTAAQILRRFLCRENERKSPTIESIREAIQFLVTVFVSTLVFEFLIALVICTSPLITWSKFYRFWGTSWMSVLAGMLTACPAAMHLFVWKCRPLHLRPDKIFEALVLLAITAGLMVVIFFTSIQAAIRPMPYLLFPVIILTAFRFNRVGCALIVFVMSYICCWTSIRGRGAMYRMAGSPTPFSSPKLILQVELFVSVLGLVGILLAAAVREKKRLARDLHTMNLELETTVSQRTHELVLANEELKESQRKAEEASQAKSDFLANMSHEIRTPIHGVMGLTALLLDTELSADQRDSLLSVQECANLLLHIINSILDLAKIEAGRVEVEFVPFNIRQLVKSTVSMLTTRAQERKLDLVWEVETGVPEWMVGDSGKIQQCLLNLVGNAVKFTHEGSVVVYVTVDLTSGKDKLASPRQTLDFENQSRDVSSGLPENTLSLLDENKVSTVISISEDPLEWQQPSGGKEISSWQNLKMQNCSSMRHGPIFCVPVKFEVRDTGIGINNEKLQDIFRPFAQADTSTSRVYGGTGLGLCIVQRFVELLGGNLQAQSEVGKGSVFEFCIPLGLSDAKNKDLDWAYPTNGLENQKNSLQSPGVLDIVHNAEAPDPTACNERAGVEDLKVEQEHEDSVPGINGQECLLPNAPNFDDFINCSNDVSYPPFENLSATKPMAAQVLNYLSLGEDTLKCSKAVKGNDRNDRVHNQDGSFVPELPSDVVNPPVSLPSPLECERKIPSDAETVQQDAATKVYSLPEINRENMNLNTNDQHQRPPHLHILLAEDNLVNQKVASRHLQKYGYTVTVVGDGLQALESVRANHDMFDLILMDVQMPMMDGLEATKCIRAEEVQQRLRRLPILGLTAHAIQGYENICLSAGMDGYLGKPFDINQLVMVIDKYVPDNR